MQGSRGAVEGTHTEQYHRVDRDGHKDQRVEIEAVQRPNKIRRQDYAN